jgi:hypothetical protein
MRGLAADQEFRREYGLLSVLIADALLGIPDPQQSFVYESSNYALKGDDETRRTLSRNSGLHGIYHFGLAIFQTRVERRPVG